MGQTCSKIQQKQQNTRISNTTIKYEHGSFILPKNIPFHLQQTFNKIQKAAYNFSQQNSIDLDYLPCITRIIAYRQQQVFLIAFKKLPQGQRQYFLDEINRIPHDKIDLFYHNFINRTQKKYSKISPNSQKQRFRLPQYINARGFTVDEELKHYQQGMSIIEAEQGICPSYAVALVIMCAGSSSRFQNQDKFLAPLNLKFNSSLTILDLIMIRLKKILKKSIPIIITCNEVNLKKIQHFFRVRNYFNYDRQKFRFMEIQCVPVLNLKGKYCLNEKFKLIKRPFGTGMTVNEILKENNLLWLKYLGIKYIHFIGAENILERPCDEQMLGVMKNYNKRVCAKCVGTANQWEKLPRYVTSKDKRIYLKRNILNKKVWKELKNSISESALYSVYQYPIATNSIVVELTYLEMLAKDYYSDIYMSQNYHILRQKQKMVDISKNKVVFNQSLAFQADIRDLLTCYQDPILLYVQRNKNYSPVISNKDEYSIQNVEYHSEFLEDQYSKCKDVMECFEKIKLKV